MAWLIPVVFAVLALACVAMAIGIPLYQALGWLRTAHWEPIPIPFSPPQGQWEGLNQIVRWVWTIHPSVHLLIIGWLFAVVGRDEREAQLSLGRTGLER